LAALLLAPACGAGEAELPPPPRPPSFEGYDPEVATRIQAALAAVEAAPRKGQTWAELGCVYASERLKNLAVDCFRAAARLEPRQPKWPYREAVTLAQTGSFEEAGRAMERSLALEPGYAPSHARLASYRLSLGDLSGAEAAFREATRLDSSYPGGWVGLARIALQRDQNAEAAEILKRLLATDPEDRTFRQLLALAEPGAAGATEGAPLGEEDVPVWNDPWELEARAFRRRPVMLEVGNLLESGRAAEALVLLEAERARGADPVETALSFATAYQQLGRVPDLERELATVLAREPENTNALLMKVQLLETRGEVKEALLLFDEVTRLQPTYGGAFAAKGSMLARHRFHLDAAAAFRRARELGVDDTDMRAQFVASLIATKSWSEALPLAEGLVRERPGQGDDWLRLAIVRQRSDQLPQAAEAIARARATGNASPKLLADVEAAHAGILERRKRGKGDAAEDEPR
jgi:tetratricopeptide (TPR) repeat protein